ncbi:MAG: hypothetical protein HYX24_01890 [Candidatus Aenigmarchaeota archaeon]|nr:hypothetical protein [Candidatus Aenigmarchaeota archaeon]
MRCPFCNFRRTQVIDKRPSIELDANRRRRICLRCKKRFTTYERIEGISTIKSIRKRDGRVVPFDQEKIKHAIFSAAQSVGGKDEKLAEKLSEKVVEQLEKEFAGSIPTVEQIQDIVEKVLVEEGHYRTAKAYILYRKQRSDTRDTKAFLERVSGMVSGYMEYSNGDMASYHSLSGMREYLSGAIISEYSLSSIYPREASRAHKNAIIHIHGLSHGTFAGSRLGVPLQHLLKRGIKGIQQPSSRPAKHFRSALGQAQSILGNMQAEWTSCQTLNNLDAYLSPLSSRDNLSEKQIKQALQEFIFSLNQNLPYERKLSAAISVGEAPKKLLENRAVLGGKEIKEKYSDFDAGNILSCLLDVMAEGDGSGKPLEIPSIVFSFGGKKPAESEMEKLAAISSGCSLYFHVPRESKNRIVATGPLGAGECQGIAGEVTINMPRIGYLSRDDKDFFSRLDKRLDMAFDSLEIKSKEIQKNMEKGLMPWSKAHGISAGSMLSAASLAGLQECSLNFLGKGLDTAEARKFISRIHGHIRKRIKENENSEKIVLQSVSGRNCLGRLAAFDQRKFRKIISSSAGPRPSYSDLSDAFGKTLKEAALTHRMLAEQYNGGALFTWKSENIEERKKAIKDLAFKYGVPFFRVV